MPEPHNFLSALVGSFALCAALLWRIHLLYWPFYLVYAAYGIARLLRRRYCDFLTLLASADWAMLRTWIFFMVLSLGLVSSEDPAAVSEPRHCGLY